MNYKTIFSLKKKVAVVVGGGGLIGREIARALSEHGARVTVADTQAVAVAKGARHIDMDITSEASIQKALRKVCRESGRIDIVINCAYPRTADWGLKLEKVPFDSWKKNVDAHMGGYFLCSRASAELMKSKGGVIINVASIYGVTAPDFGIYQGTAMTMPVAYSAIKGGIIAFTKYLATYYARNNIRANVISPGGVFNGQPAAFVREYAKKTPLGRMASPRDIAGAAVFLSSDAAAYMTGQNLIIDGGWTAW